MIEIQCKRDGGRPQKDSTVSARQDQLVLAPSCAVALAVKRSQV